MSQRTLIIGAWVYFWSLLIERVYCRLKLVASVCHLISNIYWEWMENQALFDGQLFWWMLIANISAEIVQFCLLLIMCTQERCWFLRSGLLICWVHKSHPACAYCNEHWPVVVSATNQLSHSILPTWLSSFTKSATIFTVLYQRHPYVVIRVIDLLVRS